MIIFDVIVLSSLIIQKVVSNLLDHLGSLLEK